MPRVEVPGRLTRFERGNSNGRIDDATETMVRSAGAARRAPGAGRRQYNTHVAALLCWGRARIEPLRQAVLAWFEGEEECASILTRTDALAGEVARACQRFCQNLAALAAEGHFHARD